MSDKWVTIFDVAKCTGCCNCVLATMDEHVNTPHEGYSAGIALHGDKLLDIHCVERGTHPVIDVNYTLRACQHCVDAPCASKAPDVIEVRADGIVRIRPERAKGRRDVVDACPFGAVAWNADLDMPQIWTMDVHLLDQGWPQSRAGQACPTGALDTRRVSDETLGRMLASGDYRSADPSVPAQTHVLYCNTSVLDSYCVSGRVVQSVDGKKACLAGTLVTLVAHPEADILAVTETDDFGLFRFDDLQRPEAPAKVVVTTAEGQRHEVETLLGQSRFVGTIEAG